MRWLSTAQTNTSPFPSTRIFRSPATCRWSAGSTRTP